MRALHRIGLLGATALLLLPAQASATFVETDVYSSLSPDIRVESSSGVESVHFTGSATFRVTFPTTEGSASDGDSNGLDDVPIELVALDLTGTSSLGLGEVRIGLQSMPSNGMIEEVVNNTPGVLDIPPFTAAGSGELSLEAYLGVSIGGVATFFNEDGIPLRAAISHKPGTVPEIEAMLESFPRTRLWTSSTNPPSATDYYLGVPEPSGAALLASAVAGLAIRSRRLRRS